MDKKPNVIFCLPEGLTLGGVTTWSVELSRGLNGAGYTAFLGLHPSKYNNPPVDFGITSDDHIIDCTHLPHPDEPELNPEEYIPFYQKALPGVLIPSWSWGTYAMTALLASKQAEMMRVIGMAHSDESGYYQWVGHYEAMIHAFIVANAEIRRKLIQMIPHRADDILIKSAPVNVPPELRRAYSPPGKPLQIIYGGRIAQYQKRVFELLDLTQELTREGVNFHFRIIGGGADKDEFYKKVNQLPEKTRQHISLEDSLPLSKLPELWRSTDIQVMVSEFEGVSNSMLMGMAEGCVPVMTDVSGTSEVITSGVDGILVPVGDMARMAKVIKEIDSNRNLLGTLGENAHKRVYTDYSQREYNTWFINVVDTIWQRPARPWPPKAPPIAFETLHQKFVQLNNQSIQKPDLKDSQGKKTILFLSHDPNWGGAPKVLYSLIKGLDSDKWIPIVALPGHGELEDEFQKIGVKTILAPIQLITTDAHRYWQQYEVFSNNLNERTSRLADVITREQVDLVVSNTICVFEGALAAQYTGTPHIWYIHELSSSDDKLTPLLDYPALYATMDALSDKLVVISKVVKAEIDQFFASKKIELIYTGMEAIEYKNAVGKNQTLGIETDIPVIAFIGVISERKGILSLIDTALILIDKYPQIKFVIAGRKEGETYDKLRRLIVEKQLENNFQFLGFRTDIPDVIASSDIVIIPSFVEPFSLVALEAMQAGKPVVATKSGGPEEIIMDGKTGILVPVNSAYEMAQALSQLLEKPELRKIMGKNGQEHFSKTFSYEEYIDRFEKLFDEMIAKPKEKNGKDKYLVENIISLARAATQSKADLAVLSQKEDALQVVNELLNYPGNIPFNISESDHPGNPPKVSVCVPVYNGSEYIRGCIESILAQSFTDFELILVNDASTDNSETIIQGYSDPRIRYVENDHNLGLVGNWNRCLELSRGEYICIFHQDDIMHSTNLEEKVALLDSEQNVGLVYSDTQIIDRKGRHESDHWFNLIDPNMDFIRPGQLFFDLMFENLNLVCCPSVLARRDCYENIGGFDERLPFSCDMEMWMRISLFYDVAYLSKPLMQYRFHESNMTRRYYDLDLIHIYICKQMLLEKYPDKLGSPYHDTLMRDTSQRVYERAVHHYHMRQYKTARQYLYFLETIRESMKEREIMDLYIDQLRSYVNQSNAINWLTGIDKRKPAGYIAAEKKNHYVPSRSARFYSFVYSIKSYLPPSIKNRLRGQKGKFIR